MQKAVYEVFDEFIKAPNRDTKKQVLLNNRNPILLFVLQGAFHPMIQYIFKERVPYVPSKEVLPGMAFQTMNEVMKKIYIWVDGSKRVNPNLRFERKQILFIQMLESMEPREAEVLMQMILKDLQVKNLTYKLVAETFPELNLPVNEQTEPAS